MNTKKPHIHAEVIKAWADGATIEYRGDKHWNLVDNPLWIPTTEYRVKPEPKPDVIHTFWAMVDVKDGNCMMYSRCLTQPNMRLSFDGETGKLKGVEILNDGG